MKWAQKSIRFNIPFSFVFIRFFPLFFHFFVPCVRCNLFKWDSLYGGYFSLTVSFTLSISTIDELGIWESKLFLSFSQYKREIKSRFNAMARWFFFPASMEYDSAKKLVFIHLHTLLHGTSQRARNFLFSKFTSFVVFHFIHWDGWICAKAEWIYHDLDKL